jgi:hypothetical protein
MLCNRHGYKLPAWADEAEGSVRELQSFATGLRKDWDTITAGLTVPCSSGTVEDHVNRINDQETRLLPSSAPCRRNSPKILTAAESNRCLWMAA